MFEKLLKIKEQWSERTAHENTKINISLLSQNRVGVNQINLNVIPWIFSIAPKSAGKSLDQYFTQVFTLNDILSINSNELTNLPQAIKLHNKYPVAITGQHSIDDVLYQLIPDKKLVHLGMMREPLMRVILLYNDVTTHQMITNKNGLNLVDFATFVNDFNLAEINNGQAKRLAGVLNSNEKLSDKELYFKAKFCIDNCFSLMGITEQFEDFYRILGKKSGVKFHPMPSIVRSKLKVRLTDISPELYEVIHNKNKVDIQLYEYVKSQFNHYVNLMN
jgi:hypothetical protein